jgi:hypothetical protein
MNIKTSFKYIVRLRTNTDQGSGLVFLPKDGSHDIIITAKHVIRDITNLNIKVDKILSDDGTLTELDLTGREDIKIKECQNADLACLLFPKGELSGLIGTLNNLTALDRKFDFKDCVSIGYPKENDGLKAINSKFRAFSEEPTFVIESKISPNENLSTLGLNSYDSVVGMSGGGLFYTDGACLYLSGVLFEFTDAYKDYHSICISQVNKFLKSIGISEIEVTYASSFGINEDWITKHLTTARENLGERYTKAIENLDVPEADYFRYIEVGDSFRIKLGDKFNEVIEGLDKDLYCLRNNGFTKELHDYIDSLISKLRASYHDTNWVVLQFDIKSFPLELIEEAIKVLAEWDLQISEEQTRIYLEREEKKGDDTSHKYRDEPLRSEHYKVMQTERGLRDFQTYLNGDHIRLCLNPKVLITGKAGMGKSHLLGDAVMTRLVELKPSILILGQQLGGIDNPREQILGRLGLNNICNFSQLIEILNQIGKFRNERFFFVIDALNEGNGKQFWINEIAGLIEEFSHYAHIALIFSVRSTYFDDVIPELLQKPKSLTQIEHHGFEGQELEAIQHFCRNFNLKEPSVPILSPEFSNPLFLLLFCKALKANGITEFPKGINGISEVYTSHTKSVSNALNREFGFGLPSQSNIVEDGINYLLKLSSNYENYRLKEVEDHFANFHKCNGTHLLNGMLRENILTDDVSYFSREEPKVKVVRFSYERYANHAFVKSLFDNCEDDPFTLIYEGGYLYDTAHQKKYLDKGILDALSIQLPERFNLELYELMSQDWLDQFNIYLSNESIQGIVIESLPWRSIASIDIDKIRKFIDEYLGDYPINDDLFRILILLAPNDEHPLNANFLHQRLAHLSMPERDTFWQEFIYEEFNNPKSSLSRLIDWVLDYDQHQNMTAESRILTCSTLSWMLGSPLVPLRDSATIAIVKLLEDNLKVSKDLLKKFWEVDDLYIQERLYASIYGAVIGSDDTESIRAVSLFVYQLIFKNHNPPVHLRLRDYARGIIEYAFHLDTTLNVDMKLVRPPYNSRMPTFLPKIETVEKKLKLEWNKDATFYEQMAIRGNNKIFSSLIGIYNDKNPIRYRIEHFSKTKISSVIDFEELLDSSNDSDKELIAKIVDLKNMLLLQSKSMKNLPRGYGMSFFEEQNGRSQEGKDAQEVEYRDKLKVLQNQIYANKKSLKVAISEFPKGQVRNNKEQSKTLESYLKSMDPPKNRYDNVQSPSRFLPWIVKRVFELGYDSKFHGLYDGPKTESHRAFEHYKFQGKSELIGMKYEKLAGQELMARLADNFLMVQGWGNYNLKPYNLARFEFLSPDIDTSVIYYKNNNEGKIIANNEGYENWRVENWLNEDDWPSLEGSLLNMDERGISWINLHGYKSFEEPLQIGHKKYHTDQRKIAYFIRSFFIKKVEKERIISDFKNRFFSDLWNWPSVAENHNIFYSEYYWSEIANQFNKLSNSEGSGEFQYCSTGKGELHSPVYHYKLSGINFQSDAEALKPSKLLYDGLGIDFMDKSGNGFSNSEKVLYSPLHQESALWVRKDKLKDFLDSSGLDIILTISGEKNDVKNSTNGSLDTVYRKYLIGTYSLDKDGKMTGEYHLSDLYDKDRN